MTEHPLTDNTRDLIRRLADALAEWGVGSHLNYLINEARAYLAQPEPEGPSESDVTELFYRYVGEGSEAGFENAIEEALARWGRPVIQPEPKELTDEELLAILSQAVASFPPIHPEAKALSAVEYDVELEFRKARAAIAADRARPTTTQEDN